MPHDAVPDLAFGERSLVDRSCSERVRGLIGSEILKIAADIRKLGKRIHETWKRTVDSYTVSAEEAEEERRKLGALQTQRQG